MPIPIYFAMNRQELERCRTAPPNTAWMACHFSQADAGLSNLPPALPPGSILILNDRVPWSGNDAALCTEQLLSTALRLQCAGLLLDFERVATPAVLHLAEVLQNAAGQAGIPCAAPASYLASGGTLFHPPALCCAAPGSLAPKSETPVWLDLTPTGCCVTVTENGASVAPANPELLAQSAGQAPIFRDCVRHCHYYSRVEGHAVQFFLYETPGDCMEKCQSSDTTHIALAVALYQEFRPYLQSHA